MGCLKEPVSVFISQNLNARGGFLAVGRSMWIVPHFHDPQVAVFVKADGDGIDNLWFAGDKLNLEVGMNFEVCQRRFGLDRRFDRFLRGCDL